MSFEQFLELATYMRRLAERLHEHHNTIICYFTYIWQSHAYISFTACLPIALHEGLYI